MQRTALRAAADSERSAVEEIRHENAFRLLSYYRPLLGLLISEYSIGQFVEDPNQLPTSVSHFQWLKKLRIIDEKNQLEIVTHDQRKIVIDLTTAKVVEKKKAE
jgi:hypothetical protein